MIDEKNKVITQYREKLNDTEKDLKRLREECDHLRDERNGLMKYKKISQE